ncbi:hypothetical protein BH10PSE10_BH10PSE10_21920 [soil metagenome]
MSMEIYLLTADDAPSMQKWQSAIDALAFDVRFVDQQKLSTKEIRFKTECEGKPVVMELARIDFAYVRDMFPDVMFPEHVLHIHVLRWSMSFAGSVGAYQAAAAYLALAKGLMIDTEEAKLKTRDEATKLAREMAVEIPALEAAVISLATKSRPKSGN